MERRWVERDEGRWGRSLPEPHEEVTEHEFRHLLGMWGARKVETREWCADGQKYRDLYVIYWFPYCGIAVQYPMKWKTDCSLPGNIRYELEPRYFRLGCKHDWVELSQEEARAQGRLHHGMCWHVFHCGKCDTYKSYDSSG